MRTLRLPRTLRLLLVGYARGCAIAVILPFAHFVYTHTALPLPHTTAGLRAFASSVAVLRYAFYTVHSLPLPVNTGLPAVLPRTYLVSNIPFVTQFGSRLFLVRRLGSAIFVPLRFAPAFATAPFYVLPYPGLFRFGYCYTRFCTYRLFRFVQFCHAVWITVTTLPCGCVGYGSACLRFCRTGLPFLPACGSSLPTRFNTAYVAVAAAYAHVLPGTFTTHTRLPIPLVYCCHTVAVTAVRLPLLPVVTYAVPHAGSFTVYTTAPLPVLRSLRLPAVVPVRRRCGPFPHALVTPRLYACIRLRFCLRFGLRTRILPCTTHLPYLTTTRFTALFVPSCHRIYLVRFHLWLRAIPVVVTLPAFVYYSSLLPLDYLPFCLPVPVLPHCPLPQFYWFTTRFLPVPHFAARFAFAVAVAVAHTWFSSGRAPHTVPYHLLSLTVCRIRYLFSLTAVRLFACTAARLLRVATPVTARATLPAVYSPRLVTACRITVTTLLYHTWLFVPPFDSADNARFSDISAFHATAAHSPDRFFLFGSSLHTNSLLIFYLVHARVCGLPHRCRIRRVTTAFMVPSSFARFALHTHGCSCVWIHVTVVYGLVLGSVHVLHHTVLRFALVCVLHTFVAAFCVAHGCVRLVTTQPAFYRTVGCCTVTHTTHILRLRIFASCGLLPLRLFTILPLHRTYDTCCLPCHFTVVVHGCYPTFTLPRVLTARSPQHTVAHSFVGSHAATPPALRSTPGSSAFTQFFAFF